MGVQVKAGHGAILRGVIRNRAVILSMRGVMPMFRKMAQP
jgi:hypothetical protein